MKYFAIGDEDTVLGLGMVGVKGRVVRDVDSAKQAFQYALSDTEVGIVIITERAANFIRPIVDKYIFTENFPLIVEVPDRRGSIPGRKGIRELVNAAIGISL
jgi:V/A-type H+-transporting ATPase subunit F